MSPRMAVDPPWNREFLEKANQEFCEDRAYRVIAAPESAASLLDAVGLFLAVWSTPPASGEIQRASLRRLQRAYERAGGTR